MAHDPECRLLAKTAPFRIRRDLVIILIVALVIRVPRLFESIWFDELWSTRVLLGSFLELAAVWLYDLHPPAHATLMYLWIQVCGDSEVAVRLPPLMFGLASIAVAYQLAGRWFGTFTARLTAILLCFSPVHIWYSCEARHYAATMLVVLLWTYAFDRLAADGVTPKRKTLYVVVALLAVLTHFFNAFFLFTFLLVAWIYHPALLGFLIKTHLGCAVVLGVFVAAKYVAGALLTSADHLGVFTGVEAYKLYASWLVTGNVYDVLAATSEGNAFARALPWIMQGAIALAVVRGVWNIGRGSSRATLLLCVLMAFGLPAVLWAMNVLGLRQIFVERSLIGVLPFFCVVAARGMTGVAKPDRVARAANATTGVVTVVMVVTFGLFMWLGDHWTVYQPKADWRGASRYLAGSGEAGEKRFVFVARPAKELVYYLEEAAEVRDLEFLIERRREQLGRAGQILPFLRGVLEKSAERIAVEMRRRRAEASVLVEEVDVSQLRVFLDDPTKTRCTIIRNEFWLGAAVGLIATAEAHGDWNVVESARFRGLRVFECRKKEGKARSHGATKPRSHGATKPRSHGATKPRSHGATKPRRGRRKTSEQRLNRGRKLDSTPPPLKRWATRPRREGNYKLRIANYEDEEGLIWSATWWHGAGKKVHFPPPPAPLPDSQNIAARTLRREKREKLQIVTVNSQYDGDGGKEEEATKPRSHEGEGGRRASSG